MRIIKTGTRKINPGKYNVLKNKYMVNRIKRLIENDAAAKKRGPFLKQKRFARIKPGKIKTSINMINLMLSIIGIYKNIRDIAV